MYPREYSGTPRVDGFQRQSRDIRAERSCILAYLYVCALQYYDLIRRIGKLVDGYGGTVGLQELQ